MVKRDHAGGPLTLQGWGPSKTCGRRERTCSEEGPREDAVGRQLSPRRGEAFHRKSGAGQGWPSMLHCQCSGRAK